MFWKADGSKLNSFLIINLFENIFNLLYGVWGLGFGIWEMGESDNVVR
mgnify:CR=1 FL=1